MSTLKPSGNSTGGTGTITIQPPVTNTDRTIEFPDKSGVLMARGPFVYARAASAQTVTSGVATKVTFGTEVYDTENCFASSRFTAPYDGQWRFSGVIFGIANSGMTEIEPFIYINGSLSNQLGRWRSEGSGLSGTAVSVPFNTVERLAAGSYVDIYVGIAGSTPQVSWTSTRYSFLQVSLEQAE